MEDVGRPGRGVVPSNGLNSLLLRAGSLRSSHPTSTTRSAPPALRSVVTRPSTCTVFWTLVATALVTATGTTSPDPARHPTTTTASAP